MNTEMPDYRAYLLRLWHARDDGGCWRASLEDAGTRELHVFARVEDLVSYLASVLRPGPDQAADLSDEAEAEPGKRSGS